MTSSAPSNERSTPPDDPTAAVIVQARMGSTRLPGKSMADLGGVPVIDWVLRRASMADTVSEAVIATSTNPEDDRLADHARANGWRVVRGHPTDVLDRYATALAAVDAEVIVRVTGDCPFVQPAFVDDAVRLTRDHDYVYTGHRGRFPRGFDVEALRRRALAVAAAEAVDPLEREHVTPFVARRPERFTSIELPIPPWARRSDLRLTVDEAADLELLRAIVDELGSRPEDLVGRDVIELLDRRPDLVAINRGVRHNTAH